MAMAVLTGRNYDHEFPLWEALKNHITMDKTLALSQGLTERNERLEKWVWTGLWKIKVWSSQRA